MQKGKNKLKTDLERIREWADTKIGSGSEPPWVWYEFMKLREALDAILGGMTVVTRTASLQQSGKRQGNGLRLVASKHSRGTVQRRPAAESILLPM